MEEGNSKLPEKLPTGREREREREKSCDRQHGRRRGGERGRSSAAVSVAAQRYQARANDKFDKTQQCPDAEIGEIVTAMW